MAGISSDCSPAGEENPALYDGRGIPLYKWDGARVSARSQEEIDADYAAMPEPNPTEQEQMRADIDFLSAMQGEIGRAHV